MEKPERSKRPRSPQGEALDKIKARSYPETTRAIKAQEIIGRLGADRSRDEDITIKLPEDNTVDLILKTYPERVNTAKSNIETARENISVLESRNKALTDLVEVLMTNKERLLKEHLSEIGGEDLSSNLQDQISDLDRYVSALENQLLFNEKLIASFQAEINKDAGIEGRLKTKGNIINPSDN